MVIQYRESGPASGSAKHFKGTAQKRKKVSAADYP